MKRFSSANPVWGIMCACTDGLPWVMSKLKLSVALCTYNGAEFLGAQLDSLLEQSRLPDEIVIGDDASTDGSWPQLLEFAERAKRAGVDVILHRHPSNLGYAGNFFRMLQAASGDVVFLCAQDDIWRRDKLALMEHRFTQEGDLVLLCSDARLVDGQGMEMGCSLFDALELTTSERQWIHAGDAFDVLLRRSMVTGATAAMRRELIGAALPVGAGWIHDEWIAIVAAALGRIDAVEQPLIDYRQHGRHQLGMRKRRLGDKWRDLLLPRGEQFRREVARLESLEAHLGTEFPGKGALRLEQIARKRRHFARRIAIGQRSRLGRFRPAIHEALAGNYRRYGTGVRSMLRDIFRHD